ncbi:MAG: endonuclease MutS2, partial [Eubacteriales bacterium]|nr:endonuclease MutS2 [Eubacteriales bacterium]
MNDKTYRVLEYNKIKDFLKDKASSFMTKQIIEEMTPSFDLYKIKEMQGETTEAVSVIMKKGALPLGNFYDIAGWVNLAQKGGVLTMKQLLEILYNLQVARNAANFLKYDLPPLIRIQGLAQVVSIHKYLEEEIDRSIISEDEMSDNASPELKRIRRSINLQNEGIRNKMNSIIASSSNKTMLQDTIVTMRQGRYVIPVKQEHKQKFPGIVHDQSATGATLFIEPQTIVNMNNELRELELAEKKEIHRILTELSAMVAEVAEEIKNNQNILVLLDYIFAKGKLSVTMKGVEPQINTRKYLILREARHPLIDEQKVVPITVTLGKNYNTLVITGPNTGGKTVTLKTVGLMVLMAQSGLHLPVLPGTEVPIFRRVFADIGDEQSIEQSLSTFSSHMSNIVELVKEADETTLVLLDELGAGTDPTEGAALAISILNDLYEKGTMTLATTHYTELKKYAIATDGIQNGSMEFDVETLSPTYRLTIGTPGKSNAFEISGKLGLPDSIIDYARGLLEREDIAFEDVIASIEKDRKAAEEERDEAIFLNLEIKRQKEELELEKQRFTEKKDKVLAKAKEEAREMVGEAKEFADQIKKDLQELETVYDSSQRNRMQEVLRAKIKERQGKYRDRISVPENFEPVCASELELGDRVKVVTLDQKGEVISLPDEKNEIQVQVGLMKINVNLRDVSKIHGSKPRKDKGKSKSKYGNLYQSKVQAIVPTINVVGKLLDDARI